MISLFCRTKGAVARAAVLILFVVFLVLVGSCQEPDKNREGQFFGTIYNPPLPAADFVLTNQRGKAFTLSSTRGSVVVLTFIYTHCTDACPFVALKMKEALQLLGDAGKSVKLVAVSSDPERDTVAEIAKYSDQMGLYDSWDYVTGSRADMEKVWKDYDVTVEKAEAAEETQAATNLLGLNDKKDARTAPTPKVNTLGLSDSDLQIAGQVIMNFGGGYEVAHSIPFWIIDTNGNIVDSLGADATPVELSRDIRNVLKL